MLDRRSWAWFTGEQLPPAAAPATRDEALALPAFGRGVELIAASVANTPLRAFRWNPELGIRERLADQPLVLTDPDPLRDAWQWRFSVARDLVESGNHVSLPVADADWRTGRWAALWPVPVESVRLILDPGNPARWWYVIGDQLFGQGDVLHISAGNRSGEILGLGVIDQYRYRLGEQRTAEEWAGRYLRGGGLPPAVITAPQVVTDAQVAEFRDRWRGMVETGEATIIPNGAQVVPLQSDAQRQQLVEARTWNATLAAMVLGIPPHKLGLEGPSMTYQNVETAEIAWQRDTVDRWVQPITAAMSKWLMPAGVDVHADYLSRLRLDSAAQAQYLTLLVGGGIVDVDEARQMLQYPPRSAALVGGSTPVGVPNLTAEELG